MLPNAFFTPSPALFFVFLLFSIFCNACKDTPVSDPMPNVFVDEVVNLSSIEALALQYPNGYMYTNGGLRGIIIINQPGGFLALERACPYRPLDDCERIGVDGSGLFLVDTCCGSQFGLDARILRGPASLLPRTYRVLRQGNLLYIRNEL